MDRNLDGVYFRIRRGDKYENVCFSDLSIDERELIEKVNGEERPVSWWKAMAYYLADRLKALGDFCDVEGC